MIPKIIHYCWFGGNPKNQEVLEYIETWKKHLPDYQIKEWSDKDLPLINNRYVTQAYQAKKWAFISDVFRLYALYNEGGIYFDTDVEVRKNFDEFLHLDFFIGSELYDNHKHFGTAVMGAAPKSKIIAEFLKEYDNIPFIKSNGKPDTTANTTRLLKPLKELGFKEIYSDDQPIYLDEKNAIFPVQYFSMDTPQSYAVHHFAASWVEPFRLKTKFFLPIGKKNYKLIKVKRNKQVKFNALPNAKILWHTDMQKNIFWLWVVENKKIEREQI